MWLLVLLSLSVGLSPHAFFSCLLTCVLSSVRSFFIIILFSHLTFCFVCVFLSYVGGSQSGVCPLLDSTHVSTNEPKPCFYTGHKYQISASEWTLNLTLSVSFPFLTTTFCAGRGSQNWIHGYGTLLFFLLCFKGLPGSSHSHTFCAILFLKATTGSPSTCPSFSPAH